MKVSYYPGCTLKNTSKNFEDSAISSLARLGVEVVELPRWNCCGTVYSLAADDIFHQLAPIRVLIRAKEAGSDRLMTLCAMCYNTLKRANERVRKDAEELDKINQFMYLEAVKYEGDVEVQHLLELLRDEVGFGALSERVVRPLTGLKVASYYGCLLVRPKGIGLDDTENPTVLDDLMAALGATPVDFPHKTECCGAYHTVNDAGAVAARAYQILGSAQRRGADAVVVSCPLCAFNLDHRQKVVKKRFLDFREVPVLYFTQLVAYAVGAAESELGLGLHYIDPKPIFLDREPAVK